MLDREMRELLREFKKTQPFGIRGRLERAMRIAYMVATPEDREKMKNDVKAELAKNV